MKKFALKKTSYQPLAFHFFAVSILSYNCVLSQPKNEAQSFPAVHTYASPAPGSVNTFWIETNDSIIVIDFQRALSQAKKALDLIIAYGKPVAALLITHAHTDHIAGVELFKKAFPLAKLYTSNATYEELRDDKQGFFKITKQLFPNDYPDRAPLPDVVFKTIDTLRVGGLSIIAKEMGPSDASSATLYYLPSVKAVFAGDVILNEMQGFFGEGHATEWINLLGSLPKLIPGAQVIYPGHGLQGPFVSLIAKQKKYIKEAKQIVEAQLQNKSVLSGKDKDAIIGKFKKLYPAWPNAAGFSLEVLYDLNAEGLAKEILSEKGLKK